LNNCKHIRGRQHTFAAPRLKLDESGDAADASVYGIYRIEK